MSKNRGYLLPDGDAFTDEQQCCFVYLPVGDEYRRAFFGALDYFGTWLAWEVDDAKRGKDAARAWKLANELTMECWDMGTCDLMVEKLEAIRLLLAEPQCCDGETDISNGDYYTDPVTDGVGDVPQNIIDAGYATDAADWDGFDDYKCMVSHIIIDSLESKLRKLAPMVDNAGLVFGGVATLAAIVTVIFSGGLSVLVLGILAATGATALLYTVLTSGSLLDELADDVESDHDELACAVYGGDGSAGSLVALNDKIDELYDEPKSTILTNMNLGPELKALYAGRYDQQDIAEALDDKGYDPGDFSCDCDSGPQQLIVNPTLETPVTPWTVNTSDWTLHAIYDGEICLRARSDTNDIPYASLRSNTFQVNSSFPVVQPSFRIHKYAARTWTPYCRIYRSSDDAIVGTALAGSFAQGVWDTQDTTTSIDCTGYTGIDLYAEVRMMYTPSTAAFSYLGAMWINETE